MGGLLGRRLDPRGTPARDELIALGIDPRTGEGRGQRSSISLDGGRNTTNNILDAKHGYVASLHLEHAGTFLAGDYDYNEITGELRHYLSIADRAVIAVRARAGSIDGTGETPKHQCAVLQTLLPRWRHQPARLGPLRRRPAERFGLPIGGHSFATFSTELRVPIWGNFGGVLFSTAATSGPIPGTST